MREVTHSATGPLRLTPEDIDPEKGDVAVCLCGLSDEYPFCDGSHRRTDDETPGVRYKYVDGDRRRVELTYPDSETADDEG
jgi:CDGSH-type Zn-finger protein